MRNLGGIFYIFSRRYFSEKHLWLVDMFRYITFLQNASKNIFRFVEQNIERVFGTDISAVDEYGTWGRGAVWYMPLASRGVLRSLLRVHSRAPSFFPFSVLSAIAANPAESASRPRHRCPSALPPVRPSPPALRRLPASATGTALQALGAVWAYQPRATATRPCRGVSVWVCACSCQPWQAVGVR